MGLFDIISGAKENYNKRSQAREYIQRAKELVNEGNNIYQQAYAKVSIFAHETEYKLRQHAEYKKKIAKEFGGTIGNTLSNFDKFNIDAKTIYSPTIAFENFSMQDSSFGLSVFSTSITSCIRPDIPFSNFYFSDEDYYAAKSQRDEARRFKERMKYEREALYAYRDKMSEIRSFIDMEKYELDSLMNKISKMVYELNRAMEKNSFTIEEAEYFKHVRVISGKVIELISTKFLSDNFNIDQKYQTLFEEIKLINQNLPVAPSINDPRAFDFLKNIVVY